MSQIYFLILWMCTVYILVQHSSALLHYSASLQVLVLHWCWLVPTVPCCTYSQRTTLSAEAKGLVCKKVQVKLKILLTESLCQPIDCFCLVTLLLLLMCPVRAPNFLSFKGVPSPLPRYFHPLFINLRVYHSMFKAATLSQDLSAAKSYFECSY